MSASIRELEEETGYRAGNVQRLITTSDLIDAGDIWDAGSLLALSRVLMKCRN